VVISELYKAGKAKQEALGVLAKTVICAKTGCLASGPEVVVGNVTLQLTDAVAPAPRPKPAKETRQEKLPPRQPQPKPEKPPSPQPPKPQGPSRTTSSKEPQKKEVGEAKNEEASWDRLVSLLAEETKIERTKAESILNIIFNYLATYPSAGVLRFIDDVARMSKADQRTVRTALEILRSSDVVEMREEGVVNLKRAVRREGLPL
jgi:DNA-binding transcriptional ArsR family regulator